MPPTDVLSESANTRHQVIIETKNLTRQFRHVTAVDALNLTVRRGEVFGLVGPDGAGKTTTLRLLAAIMDPTDGTATVAGFDTHHQAEDIKHHIGYMAQEFSLYPDLTVQENLTFFADIFAVRGALRRQRLQRLLEFARLTEFRHRLAGQLSGGMKKKLALACCLIHEPEVLLLDEPTTGVDPVSRREFWDILSNLHIQGTTILVCTPYMDEAEHCSTVGLMYAGRIIVCDTPAAIKSSISGQMLELRPTSDRLFGVGLVRHAQSMIRHLPGVIEAQTFGDLLHIFVDEAGQRGAQIESTLATHGIGAAGLRVTSPRMEEAFVSIIQHQMDVHAVAAVPSSAEKEQ